MTLPPVMDLLEQEITRPSGWQLRRGALLGSEGVTFKVWAPRAKDVVVHVAEGAGAGDHPLTRVEGERGVWSALVPHVVAGDRYGFRIDGGDPLPDPVSRSQPDGVHGLSEVVDPTQFAWEDGNWPGMSLPDFVIYELHVGTFTPEGTFDAIVPRLGQLAALGRDGDRADAGGGVPRCAQLGLRRRAPLRAAPRLRRARWPAPPRERRAPARARRRARRRVQPRRAGGELPRPVRSLLHRGLSHAVGARGELRRAGQRRRAALGARQRDVLDPRVPHRRAAAGRGAGDLRLRRARVPGGALRRGARARAAHGAQGAAHGRERPERPAPDPASGARRLRPRRAVVGRRTPHDPCDAHGRAPRLLPGFRRDRDDRGRLPRAVLLRAAVRAAPRPHARAIVGRRAAPAVRRLRAEPRPGGEPPPGRATGFARSRGSAAARGRAGAAVPLHSAVVHGRGVRRDGAVPVLHRARRSGADRSGAGGAPAGVRAARAVGRSAARSAVGGDLRAGEAGLGPPGVRARARSFSRCTWTCSRCGERSQP